MIFITLPLCYDNLIFNNYLKLCNRNHKNIFKIPVEIECYSGAFPFSSWNGDLNTNTGDKLLTYNKIQEVINNSFAPIRIDCSNILLTEIDLYDVHQNVILDLGNNCGNYVELSDLGLYEYIKEKYENYYFILSKHADLIHPFNENILNTFIEQDIFYLINLPNRFKNDISFLEQIKNKFKVEINIGNLCQCGNYKKENQCMLTEQHNQYEFSGCTIFQDCKSINYYNSLDLIDEIQTYQQLGFSHFKIETPPLNRMEQFNNFLIQNLIKPEYQLYFMNTVYTRGDIRND